MTTTTTPTSNDDLVQLIATHAAQHWDLTAKAAITALLAEVIGSYDAASQLVEDTDRKLRAAEYGEDNQ
ncbi:hypothetical protein ACFV0L_18775 [Streptosporangium canum]|uniref:hypothetical protein n=1 Tax=Streptosporangium canum TaxID=324952 RepID=UPI0036B0E6BA